MHYEPKGARMSHTYKSAIKGDDTTITVDEAHNQLPEPGRWVEVVKLTAAEKKAAKAELEAAGVAPDEVDEAATAVVELAESTDK